MPQPIPGLHHVTAIAGDPQQNKEFYTQVLGLRMVKKTVNHDSVTTYHLYYGDEEGTPGTNLTFFPWPGGRQGTKGIGQAEAVAFLIPQNSVEYWRDRLNDHNVPVEEEERFGETVLTFQDPDGLNVELVAVDTSHHKPWDDSPVPTEHQIRGFHSVTLTLEMHEQTGALLEDMGYTPTDSEGQRHRYTSTADIGSVVDVVTAPNRAPGSIAVGTIHHVAYRTPDQPTQRTWRQYLANNGFNVTNVIDRWYFHSIYFHEPGGVLFEIATEGPGFIRDEDLDALGEQLVLPEWLEEKRDYIEKHLPPLQ